MKVIGIVGGGQLGRMLTLAALPLGFRVIVINPTSGGPAAQAGADEIVADLYDQAALKELSDKSDYLTIEIEHLDANILDKLADSGASINPAPKTVQLIQDKYLQKEFLHKAGIPVAPFAKITDEQSAKKALKSFGGKMLIKTRHGAYDGRGNMVVMSGADIKKALELFADRQLYAEAYVPFSKELAVIIAKSTRGESAIYPVVETIHERNICVEVLAPADIISAVKEQAESIAHKVADLLEGAGVVAVEMFLTKDGQVLLNEIAPRVHNSGHHTIEANRTSQFEQHVRALTGLPLGSTDMTVPAAVMINILGERDGPVRVRGLEEALAHPHTSIHLYGKSPTKVDRKMGHITATGKTIKEARSRARSARRHLIV